MMFFSSTSSGAMVAVHINDETAPPKLVLLLKNIICGDYVKNACLRCQAESKQDTRYGRQDCVVVWGECNHSFHYCCMSLWVKQNNRCPLCQQEWSIQRMGK